MEIPSISVFLWLFLTLSAAGLEEVSAESCTSGWTQHGSRCFKFISTQKTWASAERSCLDAGGNLASVHSYDEQIFIQDLILSATHGFPRTWIGGYDAPQDTVWFWSDGTKVDFKFWAYEKPDGPRDNCMVTNSAGALKWDNDYCTSLRPYMCARELHEPLKPREHLLFLVGAYRGAVNRTNELHDKEPLSDLDTAAVAPNVTILNTQHSWLCPYGWEEYESVCYAFINIKESWSEAEQRCKQVGGHLASVHSNEQYNFLRQLVWTQASENVRTWIGGTDAFKEGSWTWTDGTIWNYNNWASGQPNNLDGKQHCLDMNFGEKWNDENCEVTLPFICRKPVY
ncbi:C-type mannose receptor 2 [Chanos chanos]|uniref:C-type lectin n=1 Tax=Chanos chanos TaxID=29144 RepID=A0A411DYS1_CHACN|nr:C-type mannose receptor 2-like [Chanos chanos]XP_030635735.1 C-type mannose receptor 2-like [Chanos chanos]QBA31042.1 C-type lectin [Chanos chanos]